MLKLILYYISTFFLLGATRFNALHSDNVWNNEKFYSTPSSKTFKNSTTYYDFGSFISSFCGKELGMDQNR